MRIEGDRTLYILEGFVSFKGPEDKRLAGGSSYTRDAENLLKYFKDAYFYPNGDCRVENVLNLLGVDGAEEVVPIIIISQLFGQEPSTNLCHE